MTKVTLLGDSIRASGYGNVVPELLGEEYEVYQPNVNGRNAKYTLRCLFDYASQMAGSRIVHWNNGHWDLCELFGDGPFTPVDEYVNLMVRIAKILKTRAKKVIFATTTPVTPENPYNKMEVIMEFNAKVSAALEKEGVIINDLFTTINADVRKYIDGNDNIHLTKEGIKLAADQVANVIREAAKDL